MGRNSDWPKELEGLQGPFLQAYRRYQLHKKEAAADHGYGASANYAQEAEAQVMTLDALKSLANSKMEDKEAMSNLTRTNLTLYQRLNKSKEEILVISKQLKAIQSQMKSKKPAADKPAMNKKQYLNK